MDGHPHSDVGVQLRSNDCQEIGSAETIHSVTEMVDLIFLMLGALYHA